MRCELFEQNVTRTAPLSHLRRSPLLQPATILRIDPFCPFFACRSPFSFPRIVPIQLVSCGTGFETSNPQSSQPVANDTRRPSRVLGMGKASRRQSRCDEHPGHLVASPGNRNHNWVEISTRIASSFRRIAATMFPPQPGWSIGYLRECATTPTDARISQPLAD